MILHQTPTRLPFHLKFVFYLLYRAMKWKDFFFFFLNTDVIHKGSKEKGLDMGKEREKSLGEPLG